MTAALQSLYRPNRLSSARSLALRAEVEQFNADYCAVLDTGNIEDWPRFFTQDAIYRITARENAEQGLLVGLVYAQGKGMLHDRAIAISRTQMFAPRYALHQITNIRVTNESANGEIEAQANFSLFQTLVEEATTVHMVGTYYDTFVRADGRLLLKERQAIYDSSLIANDLAYPL